MEHNFKTLVIQDSEYVTLFTPKFEKRKPWTQPDPKKIYAPIPGTILEVYVKVGQSVKVGDKYMLLESMKMENKFTFALDGVVKAVNITKGTSIAKGLLVVELE